MKKLTKFLFTLALIASFVTISSCSKKENYSLLTEEDFSSQWLNGKWQFSVIAKDNLSGRTETFSKEIIEFNTENQTATLPEYTDTSDELTSTIAEFFKDKRGYTPYQFAEIDFDDRTKVYKGKFIDKRNEVR